MMNGFDAGMTAMMIASAVFYLVLLALAVLGIVWLVRALRGQTERNSPAELLHRRYAAGGIDEEEYHKRLNGLRT
jgi:putative membrane protein